MEHKDFKLLFGNQIEDIEALITKIKDGTNYSIDKKGLYILFDRYYETQPFNLDDFVQYAHRILNLKRQMYGE